MSDDDRIPPGPYCYRAIGRCNRAMGAIKIERCPYWRGLESDAAGRVLRARCERLGLQDEFQRDTSLLWDQVKACGLNLDEAGDGPAA